MARRHGLVSLAALAWTTPLLAQQPAPPAAPAAPAAPAPPAAPEPPAAPAPAAAPAAAPAPSYSPYPPGPYWGSPGYPPYPQPVPDRGASPAPAKPSGPPPPARGFQLGVRPMGFDAPAGNATAEQGDTMSARHSLVMLSLGLDPGFKVSDEIFLGGYYTLNLGGLGRDNERTRPACRDSDQDGRDTVKCDSVAHHFGLQAQYHFRPAATVNPWLGLGFGWEIAQQKLVDFYGNGTGTRTETSTSRGWNVKLDTAVDFRLGRVLGLGPYMSFTWGWYESTTTTIDGQVTYDGDIPETATHRFIGGGFRMVFLP